MYNDESTACTDEIINRLLPFYHQLKCILKKNRAWPKIAAAYDQMAGYDWVLQIDSDPELPVSVFQKSWNFRNEYDLVLGERIRRNALAFRVLLTTLTSYIPTFTG